MVEKLSEFGSDEWIPHLNKLFFEVLNNLRKRPGGRFLRFRDDLVGTIEKPGKIIEEYHDSANSLKSELFGDKAKEEHLDHHKIAALYIRSFLIHRPFILDIPTQTKNPELCLNTKLSNEYFSVAYLASIFKSWNDKFDWTLQMDARYKFDLIKLLYHYKTDINKFDTLSFSHIIYNIEQHYFKGK